MKLGTATETSTLHDSRESDRVPTFDRNAHQFVVKFAPVETLEMVHGC